MNVRCTFVENAVFAWSPSYQSHFVLWSERYEILVWSTTATAVFVKPEKLRERESERVGPFFIDILLLSRRCLWYREYDVSARKNIQLCRIFAWMFFCFIYFCVRLIFLSASFDSNKWKFVSSSFLFGFSLTIWLCAANLCHGNSIFHQWHATSSSNCRYQWLLCIFTIRFSTEIDFGRFSLSFAEMRDFEFDLLHATSKSEQNYVAFGTEADAIIKTPSSNIPSTLREMAIVSSVRAPFSGGYLWSIVKPLDSVVSLGISMYPLRRNTYNISLIYTNTNLFVKSQNVATFQFTYARDIIDVALRVSGHQITLYVGCYELKTISRDPVDTIIDRDSKMYVASAGSKQKNGFKVRGLRSNRIFASIC